MSSSTLLRKIDKPKLARVETVINVIRHFSIQHTHHTCDDRAKSDLVCLQVSLTWDETPHERVSFMARDFSKDELADQDLRDYIASDTDSGGMFLISFPISLFLSCIYSTVSCE